MISQTKCQAGGRPSRIAVRSPAALLRRGLAIVEDWVAYLLHWQSVSRRISRLSALSDAELERLGIERHEIVAEVFEAARAEWDRRR